MGEWMNSMNDQPTGRVANGGENGAADRSTRSSGASSEETRAIPVRQVGSYSTNQPFSSQPTIAANPVVPAEKTARMGAQPVICGEYARDPFEPSTPDPAMFPQQPYAPGSTAPVATRYSESSRVKKKRPLAVIFVGALVALIACAFVLFHTNDASSSSPTPQGGVTQSQRSEGESGESPLKTPGVQQNAATLTVDASDLAGEKWSNAKKILEVRGADVDSIVVLTDDGKDVWDASNWTVESIAVEDGALTAHLVHDSGSVVVDAVSGALEDGAADTAGGVLDAAGEAVRSAGETAAEKATEFIGSLL